MIRPNSRSPGGRSGCPRSRSRETVVPARQQKVDPGPGVIIRWPSVFLLLRIKFVQPLTWNRTSIPLDPQCFANFAEGPAFGVHFPVLSRAGHRIWRIGQIRRLIVNSGKVGEFVAGDLWGRLAGVAAGDSGNASKRRSAGWISVREVDARVTAAQVHFTHAPVTKSGVGEFRLEMWSRRCDGRRPRRQAHTVQMAADRTWVGEGGDDLHT